MLISTFFPWFVYEASYSVNIAGYGGMSAQSNSETIPGYYISQSYLAILFALGAICAAFTKFKYSFSFGVVNLLVGIYTASFWKGTASNLNFSIQENGVKADSSFSLAIGLWIFLGAASAYSILAVLPLLKGNPQPNWTDEELEAQPYAPSVVSAVNRPTNRLVLAVCITAVVGIALPVVVMQLMHNQTTLANTAADIRAKAPTNVKDDAVPTSQNLSGMLSAAQRDAEVATDNVTEDGTSGIHHYAEEAMTAGRFPQASAQQLTQYDLASLSKVELKLMRNEIFARRGYIFKDEQLNKYFNQQEWYQPLFEDISDQLTPTEKANIALIKQLE